MKKILLLLALTGISQIAFSQVGINTTSPNAQLDIKSSNQLTPANTDGILIPKIDAFPLTAPTAAQNSMLVYLTTVSLGKQPGFYYWDNASTSWKGFGGGLGWELNGNSGTNSTNFLGTTDPIGLNFKVNSQKAGLLDLSGNSFFGVLSGNGQTGNNNTAIGKSALSATSSANGNTAVGFQSLAANNSGQQNTAIGYNSLPLNTSGGENAALGFNALATNDSGFANTAVGSQALYTTKGSNNVGIGYFAGSNISTGSNNIAIGLNAQVAVPTGSAQLTIGNSVFGTDIGDLYNAKIGIGTNAPSAKFQIASPFNPATPANTDGVIIPQVTALVAPVSMTAAQNSMMVFLKTASGSNQPGFYYWDQPTTSWKGIGTNTANAWNLTGNSGTNPVANFLGTTDDIDLVFKRFNIKSGSLNPINTSFGVSALAVTTGFNNAAFGASSLSSNTTGTNNAAFGQNALASNTKGSSNFAFGYNSMGSNTTAGSNVAIGANCMMGQNFSNGGVYYDTNNIGIGIAALAQNNPTATNNGIRNVAIGTEALGTNKTGMDNIGIGYQALLGGVPGTGNYNIAIGSEALKANTFGEKNTAIGVGSLFSNTTGILNTATGYLALYKNTSGGGNVAIGPSSLYNNDGGYNNVALGNGAMAANISGFDNVAIGSLSLGGNGSFNVSIGEEAMRDNLTGQQNTSVGFQAMEAIKNGNYNTAMGTQALIFNMDGNYNSAYGWKSLFRSTGSYNTGLGVNAMTNATTGDFNTVVGTNSLLGNTGSSNNTTLGYATLQNNVSGSGNIAIGNQAGANETGSNKLYIENSNSTTPLIYGDFAADLARINGNLRVKSTTVAGADMQLKNSNLYIHSDDANLNFGTGLGYFMMSTQDSSPGNETGGIRGDGDNVAIWSPGDGGRQLRILDEDAWTDNNGNPYDNGAEVAYIAANGQYFQVSDKNKKENIQKIENPLEKITKLSGYTYQYKLLPAEIEKGQKPSRSSGVLAQEVEQVLPEAVQKNESGEYFVDYAALTPLLLEALKSQNEKIKQLENSNAEILKRLEKLENK